MSRINTVLSRVPILDIFSNKKLIKNNFINRLGTQPFRIWLADKRYALRSKFLDESIKGHIETLQKDGVVVIENFLPQEVFDQLEKECKEALKKEGRSRRRQDGPNEYSNLSIRNLGDYKTIQDVFHHKEIEKLFKAAERRNLNINQITRLLSCLTQGEDNGTIDPETNLHEDTFFNTHKAWLYITDVEMKNAPFVYVKGSNDHSKTDRLKKSYEYSLDKNNIHSRRISEEQLKELGLEETIFTAKKNTLVLANTLGFHRRMRGEAGNIRIGMAFSARFNPFL